MYTSYCTSCACILVSEDSVQGIRRNKSFGSFHRGFELEDVCGYVQSGVQVCVILIFLFPISLKEKTKMEGNKKCDLCLYKCLFSFADDS